MDGTSKHPTLSPLHEAARAYAKSGYHVFPLSPGNKKPLACSHGFKDATTDLEQIDKWWTDTPKANIGISTGDPSGRVVLDVDVKDGAIGMQSLAGIEDKYGQLQTRVVHTPSGGLHYYFRKATGCPPSSNQAATLGLDLKSNGGYVVAPPSVVDGKAYQWEDTTVPIAPMPQWLPAVFAKEPAKKGPLAQVAHVDALAGAPQGSRNQSVFAYACSLRAKGMKKKEAETLVLTMAAKCSPPLQQPEALKCLESAWKYRARHPFNDLGNGDRFVELHGDHFRYVIETGVWLKKVGQIFEPAKPSEVTAAARGAVALLETAARNETDSDAAKTVRKFALKSGDSGRLKAMIEVASRAPQIEVPISCVDTDPYLAGTTAGVIDLQTGKLATAVGIITKRLGAAYDPLAVCPRFESFLIEIFEGNKVLIRFVQRIGGYFLTGSTEEHTAFWFYGPGANGKSVLLNIFQAVLGNYAITLPAHALQQTNNPNQFALSRVPGARMIRVSEVGPTYRLNESLLKDICSSDLLTTERKGKDSFQFTNTGKLVCATNNMPRIEGTDHGIWRRQIIIPMMRIIPPDKQDKMLEERICNEELSGVLKWMLDGLTEWQKTGLATPNVVQNMVNEYRLDEDPFEAWFRESCELTPGSTASASDLYQSYRKYALDTGGEMHTQNRLGRWLQAHKQLKRVKATTVHYVGVKLVKPAFML